MEAAIAAVFLGMPPGTRDERDLRQHVAKLSALGASGLAEKLCEFKDARRSGRFASLMMELEFARFVAEQLKATPSFHINDAPDVSFLIDGTICLADVVHKSAPLSYANVFHPMPEDLALYSNTKSWQAASLRLHSLLQTLPVAIQPWLGKQFLEQRVTGRDRAQQEDACGVLASWLADELAKSVPLRESMLRFTDGVTRFDIEYLDAAPGFMNGHAAVEAWFVVDGTLRQSIEEKAKKARERLARMGPGCYVVVLGVADTIASVGGRDLLTTLLGPLTQHGSRTYRPVPAGGHDMIDEALRLDRRDLIEAAQFDPTPRFPRDWPVPAYFDRALQDVGAVIAFYPADEVHFVPNPFTTNVIAPLLRYLPADFKPFESTGSLRSSG